MSIDYNDSKQSQLARGGSKDSRRFQTNNSLECDGNISSRGNTIKFKNYKN
jgi:hypothetical protein